MVAVHLSRDRVLEYVLLNLEHLKDMTEAERALKYNILASTDPAFHDEVLKQYKDAVKEVVLEQIAQDTGVDTETIHILLDDLDITYMLEVI